MENEIFCCEQNLTIRTTLAINDVDTTKILDHYLL